MKTKMLTNPHHTVTTHSYLQPHHILVNVLHVLSTELWIATVHHIDVLNVELAGELGSHLINVLHLHVLYFRSLLLDLPGSWVLVHGSAGISHLHMDGWLDHRFLELRIHVARASP